MRSKPGSDGPNGGRRRTATGANQALRYRHPAPGPTSHPLGGDARDRGRLPTLTAVLPSSSDARLPPRRLLVVLVRLSLRLARIIELSGRCDDGSEGDCGGVGLMMMSMRTRIVVDVVGDVSLHGPPVVERGRGEGSKGDGRRRPHRDVSFVRPSLFPTFDGGSDEMRRSSKIRPRPRSIWKDDDDDDDDDDDEERSTTAKSVRGEGGKEDVIPGPRLATCLPACLRLSSVVHLDVGRWPLARPATVPKKLEIDGGGQIKSSNPAAAVAALPTRLSRSARAMRRRTMKDRSR